ncbi:hypothetical protein [Mycobacteroides franklinii]|uniref:hypothetical protein n=1 Tax=Mycobacteroides franklinii TaxID=948102 RepID=UPI0013E8AC9E
MAPADAGHPDASLVYVRQVDSDSKLATTISITEHLLTNVKVDLEAAADRYTAYLKSRVGGLHMTRSDYISYTPPLEYGQEFEFVLEQGDSVYLMRICISLPLAHPSTLIEEIVFTTPKEMVGETKRELVKFLESLEVRSG